MKRLSVLCASIIFCTLSPHDIHIHLGQMFHSEDVISIKTDQEIYTHLGAQESGSPLRLPSLKFCGAMLTGTYATLTYILKRGERFMRQRTLWSAWHQELIFEHISPEQMISLRQELQQNNPSHFTRECTKEICRLKRYDRLYRMLKHMRCVRLFFFDRKLYEEIPRKIARIEFLMQLFERI